MLPQVRPEEDWNLGSLRENDYAITRVISSEKSARVLARIAQNPCRCSFECAAYNNLVFNPRSWPSIIGRLIASLRKAT
jgi:hypothetical protein